MDYKPGDIICFTENLYEQIGHRLLIEANMPIKIQRINKNHVFVMLKDGTLRSFRYIPERMYMASEAAKVIYG